MPKVSITMPTYNGEKYLKEAIDSVISQSFTDFELIIVVDGSSDSTAQIINNYKDNRIKTILKPKNEGLPAALNTGLDASTGYYWTWTSDDNTYLPDALKVMVEYLDIRPELSMVATGIYHIDKDGRVTRITNTDVACFLCRTDAAKKTGYRVEYMLVEDVDFLIRYEFAYGKMERIDPPHYKYRDHPGSLSTTRIQERQYVSNIMHYDLITRGIEKGSAMGSFQNGVRVAALYHGYEWMDKIVAFVKAEKLPYADWLAKKARFYKTPLGWLLIKLRITVGGRIIKLFAKPLKAE